MSDWDKLREKLNLSEEEEMIIDAEKDKLRIILENKRVIKNDVGRVQNRYMNQRVVFDEKEKIKTVE